ncbi:MAG: NYN domain-containing protein [Acidobacteria bacterium]|nr:NYN domain-containing protein [Acidobacteriota bacterium]MCC6452740.1 NYN domain-containing protein [Acidobacteriota bacterium]
MKINIYIDGFNLYYGALRGTHFKWMNPLSMCKMLFPNDSINKIKYFTARVSARPSDPDQPTRQNTYFRALQTVPEIEIIEGSFLTKEVTMPVAHTSPQQYVRVIKTEEKGSDVNLAVHLLNDAFKRDFELGVMITNDSDLLEPLKIVKYELGLPVGIVNPQKHPSFHLKQHATFIKTLRQGVVKASQFATTLNDAHGTFHKPEKW